MRRVPGFLLVSLFTVVATVVSASTLRGIRVIPKSGRPLHLYTDYYALVVGVSDYKKWPDLPNAVKDAKEVAAALRSMGFSVKTVLDPTSQELHSALNDMAYEMGGAVDRAVLFYYAGHGETETLADKTKMGYIIPRDCPLLKRDPMGFADCAVSMRDIESVSLRIKAKHVLMLFDSCFSGSLFALVRAVPHDITEKSALPVRQYITAGTEDEPVPDRSMFKRSFLVGLEGDADLTGDGYITGSELGMYLSDKVVNYTRKRQHPQYGKINNPALDRGDFIFVPKSIREEETVRTSLSRQGAVEEELKRLREERERTEALVQELRALIRDTGSGGSPGKAGDTGGGGKGRVEAEDPDKKAVIEALETEVKRLRAQIDRQSKAMEKMENQQPSPTPGDLPGRSALDLPLRSRPQAVSGADIKEMIRRYTIFIKGRHEKGDFPNDFVDNGDGTVTDKATGLMWVKAASPKRMRYRQAKSYVAELNEEKFLGHDDWRIPTLEELCSLIEPKQTRQGLHVNPAFENMPPVVWSGDEDRDSALYYQNRVVNFSKGKIESGRTHTSRKMDDMVSGWESRCAVIPVRSIH